MKKAENKATARGARTGRLVTVRQKAGIGVTTLKQAGGSVMVTVPAHVRRDLKLAVGDTVRVAAENGRVVIEPVRVKPHFSLDEILAKCNPDAPLSAEEQAWRDDKPVGGEIW